MLKKMKRKLKKSKRGIKKKVEATRHIPNDVSQKVTQRHFFECAWDGVKLTERHHIREWSLGGEHAEENLILLCPTCHALAHKGEISSDQLKDRKSTHLKADRVGGNFQTSLEVLKLKMGSNFFIDVKHLIAFKYQPILSWAKENDNILLSANFFDSKGDLVFWMRRNVFWSPSNFTVTSSLDKLLISNGDENILEFSKEEDHLNVKCRVYLGRELFQVTSAEIVNLRDGRSTIGVTGGKFTKMHIGFWKAPTSFTEEEFLKRNNETTELTGDGLFFNGRIVTLNPKIVKKGKIQFD
jgi:hypothetical protein